METEVVDETKYNIHQSVKDLRKRFPMLNLPSTLLECNIEPCIILERDTVKNFLRKVDRNKRRRAMLSKGDRRNNNTRAASIVTDRLQNTSLSTMITERSGESNFVVSGIVGENLSNGPSDRVLSVIHRNTVNPKKRRLTDSDLSYSEPLPNNKPSEKLCLEKSVPLFVCDICESVHNNARQLKMHHFKHFRCPLCRSQFTSLESRDAHIESMCEIKKRMNHLPSVELKKIELDLRMRANYPDAFIGYPLISDPHLDPTSTEYQVSENNRSKNDEKAVDDGVYNNDDVVIEMLPHYDASLLPGKDASIDTPLRKKVPARNSFFLPTNCTATEKVSSVMSNSSSAIILPDTSNASGSNEDGLLHGRIRVRNLQEMM